ncbi:MAG: hypothetical protein ACREOB_06880 [Thermodesulfobacteriota bacterium]
MNKLIVLGTVLYKLLARDSKSYRAFLVKLILVVIVLGVGFALIFAGFAFIIWGFYLYLASSLQAHIAALVTGVVILLVAVALVVGTKLLIVRPRKRKKQTPPEAAESGARAEVLSLVHDYTAETFLVALAAGFLVGISTTLRKVLTVAIVWLFTENLEKSKTN